MTFGAVILNTGTGNAITFSGDGGQNKSGPFIVEKLKIVGNPSSRNGISIKNGQIVTIRDNHIVAHGGAGIYISAGINNAITRNRIQGNFNGIEVVNQATTLRITENRIEDNTSGAAGIKVSNSDLISIVRNTIESNDGKGVWFVGPMIQAEIIGNWFEANDQQDSGDEDVFIEGGASNDIVSRVMIQSNRFNSLGVGTSLRIQRGAESVVLANLFAAASITNIELTEGSNDNLMLWNTLAGDYKDHGLFNIRNEHSFRGNDLGTQPNIYGRLNLNGNRIYDDSDLSDRSILFGKGSPEGVVPARVGSLYLRRNGAPGETLYIKESGVGTTGWVAK
jgi:parallel beta-helix repeat protein